MKPTILIVDDDTALARTLANSFSRRGLSPLIAHTPDHALRQAARAAPTMATVDLKLESGSGLHCIESLRSLFPTIEIAVLTGYASVTAALEATKAGANAFLRKPATADDILDALRAADTAPPLPRPERQMSLRDLEWERMSRALLDNDFNISATAETLSMARRHLQKRIRQVQTRSVMAASDQ